GVEAHHVQLGELVAVRAGGGAGVALLLVVEAELAPRFGPVILVERLDRGQPPFGILAKDVFERIEAAGPAHELGLDLIQRALARTRDCLHVHIGLPTLGARKFLARSLEHAEALSLACKDLSMALARTSRGLIE